jgi:hypothetical protein
MILTDTVPASIMDEMHVRRLELIKQADLVRRVPGEGRGEDQAVAADMVAETVLLIPAVAICAGAVSRSRRTMA